jgi:hypothetical protein
MSRRAPLLLLLAALAVSLTGCELDPTTRDTVTYTTTVASTTRATPTVSTTADPGFVSTEVPQRLQEVAAEAADSDCSIETPRDTGRIHIGEAGHLALNHPAYSSDPPTSGPHYGITARWGFYGQQIPDEYVIHNLEHGGVAIWYEGDPADYALLFDDLLKSFRKVVISPRANIDGVAATAWGVIMRCNGEAVDALGTTDLISLLTDFTTAAISSPELSEGSLPARVMGTRKSRRKGKHFAALPAYPRPVIDTTIGK